jgi:indoleamine 2,3-dioxygenase
MFPNGVLYEGVPELANTRVSFRGESGANDSMIPLVDNLLSIPMPSTPLTEILKDFRSYRPGEHRRFLEWVKTSGEQAGLKDWALDGHGEDEDEEAKTETRALWIKVLDQVRDFRWRHWCFAREYILKRTSHPTATGGSPIVTWLPNQLAAVMDEMVRVYEAVGGGLGQEVEGIMDLVGRQREMLAKEVRKFCEERGVQGDGV